MKLIEIEIENFRGVKEKQKINIFDLTTLIGKNDSGKSIVLHAVATFLDNAKYPIGDKDFNINRDDDLPIKISCLFEDENLKSKLADYIKNNRKKDVGIEEEVNAIIGITNQLLIRKIWRSAGKKPTSCEVGVIDFEDEKYKHLTQKTSEELDTLLKEFNIGIPADLPGRNSKLEKAKHIRNHLLKNNYKETDVWKEEPNIDEILPRIEFFQSDHAISVNTEFKTGLRTETTDFFTQEKKQEKSKLIIIEEEATKIIQKEADEITSYMQMHVKDLEKIEIQPNFEWIKAIEDFTVKFKFKKDRVSIPMENKGAGYRRLFMVGRFRYLASKVAEAKNDDRSIIYAIEEPETFLHPSAQEDLLMSLKELSENNQILITTHSPVFAGATKLRNIVLCQEDVQSVYIQRDDDTIIDDIITDLGIKPFYNLRDKFETIVFTEGPGDIFFLKLAADKLLDLKLDNAKVLFLHGGGKTIDNFVNIKYFSHECKRRLFLILDGNQSEISDHFDTRETLRKKVEDNKKLKEIFELNKKAKCFILKKRCIENYYHPAAIKRLYPNAEFEFKLFSNDKNIRMYLNQLNKEKSAGIKVKNNEKIYNEMTKNEWKSVSDGELEQILKEIVI